MCRRHEGVKCATASQVLRLLDFFDGSSSSNKRTMIA